MSNAKMELQELKAKEAALLAKIAQEEREQTELETSEKIRRLLIDLKHEEDFSLCRVPLDTLGRVQFVFSGKLCRETCGNFSTCQAITDLSKAPKKAGGKGGSKKAKLPFKYSVVFSGDINQNAIIHVTESPVGPKTFTTTKSSSKGFRKILTDTFCLKGITGNQVSGLTKILNQKGYKF